MTQAHVQRQHTPEGNTFPENGILPLDNAYPSGVLPESGNDQENVFIRETCHDWEMLSLLHDALLYARAL